jgi:folate-dependent phosphoribosylglycinamide formyltransferase PurN/peptidoglycan/xylan/chitin deacetylase (PgdA/CDA1 family)
MRPINHSDMTARAKGLRAHNSPAEKFKIAILTGENSPWICSAILMLTKLPQVEVAGILFDTAVPPLRKRVSNLKRNIRREGLIYLYFRLGTLIVGFLERIASRVVDHAKVMALLHRSFPEQAFCLSDLEKHHDIPVLEVGDLNDRLAADTLRSLKVDLGVVIGTRILRRSTFSIPQMGCINLHEGKMPEYRGLPPGFWELYERQETVGVTVHFVDDGLDTGDILGEDTVAIHPSDSPDTLVKKLNKSGGELLAKCVVDLAAGRAIRRKQLVGPHKARTLPTQRQRRELEERIDRSSIQIQQSEWIYILKTVFYLIIFYTGFFNLVRAVRRIRKMSRGCILLYHRVNDLCEDALTTEIERFAQHVTVLREYYRVLTTSEIVDKIRSKQPLSSTSLAIHFDDSYKDVLTCAAPILMHAGFSACCFISSGYIGKTRLFAHDSMCPFILENLDEQDVRALVTMGFEVGAHTVNHLDMGSSSHEVTVFEVEQSKRDLESILEAPVYLFSYPFGGAENVCDQLVDIVRDAGYTAMFSAHGGYVTARSSAFLLPRVGVCSHSRPLDLLMEIEGLSLGALKMAAAKRIRKYKRLFLDDTSSSQT